jgi:hypothetical protein
VFPLFLLPVSPFRPLSSSIAYILFLGRFVAPIPPLCHLRHTPALQKPTLSFVIFVDQAFCPLFVHRSSFVFHHYLLSLTLHSSSFILGSRFPRLPFRLYPFAFTSPGGDSRPYSCHSSRASRFAAFVFPLFLLFIC